MAKHNAGKAIGSDTFKLSLALAIPWVYAIVMQIIRDHTYINPDDRGAVAAIGNFDGVHLGHQTVINIARKMSDSTGTPLGVLTFEPHPREFFAPEAPPFRLMGSDARAHRLEKLGVEKLYELNFNAELSTLSPSEFSENIVWDALGLSHVVVGADFRFGKGRAGDSEDLTRFGEIFGFGVTVANLLQGDAGEVSSTAIRNALSDGRPRDAADMLGHWHRIEGVVVAGDQRGRKLGFPTANISINGLHPPKHGIYAVYADVLDGRWKGHYTGAANIGKRPMFNGEAANLECHLFDFQGDLYGAHLSVALVEYIRPEETFESMDSFISRMNVDCAEARRILAEP